MHNLYAFQIQVTSLQSFRSTRNRDKDPIQEWLVEWAPIMVATSHAQSMTTMKSTLLSPSSTAPHPDFPDITKIWWHPSRIRQKDLLEMVGPDRLQELKSEFQNKPHAKYTTPAPPLDSHLTNAQKQGEWTPTQPLNFPLLKTIRDHIHMDPLDRHPDCDIQGTGRYTIQVGLILPGSTTLQHPHRAHVYSPKGTCLGHMPIDRLTMLSTQYEATKRTKPLLYAELGGTYLEADIAALLLRYRAAQQDKTMPPSELLTLHPAINGALQGGLQITHERFASPLDYSHLSPTYSSKYPADQLFGANLEAYSQPWLGSSIAHPPYGDKEMHKAMRWAIASAQWAEATQQPSCTILALPSTKWGAYSALLAHPMVYQLAALPTHIHPYLPTSVWTGGKTPPPLGKPRARSESWPLPTPKDMDAT